MKVVFVLAPAPTQFSPDYDLYNFEMLNKYFEGEYYNRYPVGRTRAPTVWPRLHVPGAQTGGAETTNQRYRNAEGVALFREASAPFFANRVPEPWLLLRVCEKGAHPVLLIRPRGLWFRIPRFVPGVR